MFKFLLLIEFVGCFTLLNNIAHRRPKSICPCPFLPDSVIDIIKEQNLLDLNCDNNSGEVCLSLDRSFMQIELTQFGYPMTNIYIAIRHLPYPNTLYNVVLHESLHALGLGHSDKPGIMNYSITVDGFSNRIINDNKRLWLSGDDLNGLYYIEQTINSAIYYDE